VDHVVCLIEATWFSEISEEAKRQQSNQMCTQISFTEDASQMPAD
jgi:hypothetical protein